MRKCSWHSRLLGLKLVLVTWTVYMLSMKLIQSSRTFSFPGRTRSWQQYGSGSPRGKLTVPHLKDKLKELGQPVSGKKADLLMRIRGALPEIVPKDFVDALEKETVKSLQEKLRSQLLPASGVKKVLVGRLVEAKLAEELLPDAAEPSEEWAGSALQVEEAEAGTDDAHLAETDASLSKSREELLSWWQSQGSSNPESDSVKAYAARRIVADGEMDADRTEKMLEELFEEFPELRKQLSPYQLDGVKFAANRQGRCLLGDEMGLGKTLQALVAAQLYAEEWPLLVIAPVSVLVNWQNEVKKWFPHLSREVEVFTHKPKSKPTNKLIRIIGYERITRYPELALRDDGEPYEVVIVDEAHQIKTPEAQRTQALLNISLQARRLLLLSGTPVLNSASEVWSLLKALDPEVPDYFDFCERYSERKERNGEVIQVGVKRGEELHLLLNTVMIRRRKRDTMALPSKQRIKYCIPSSEIASTYTKKVMGAVMKQKAFAEWQGFASKVFSITAKAKADKVAEYVKKLLDKEDKLVVFAHHMDMLDKLEKEMKHLRVPYIRIDGRTQTTMRKSKIRAFQEDPEKRVALLGLTALGQGITLTSARIVVFAELYWVPGRLLQAEDRVHRRGQESEVEIHYCMIQGQPWLDETIWNKLVKKEVVINEIVDRSEDGGNFGSPMARSKVLA